MRVKELQIRACLFAVSFLAMLYGYQALLFQHAPDAFRNVMEDMSYGWYVPLFSLYVVWHDRQKIIDSIGKPALGGTLLILPFVFIGFIGVRGVQIRFEIVGFVGVLLGLVWSMFGLRTMRAVLFPILFLLFCIPLHSYLDLITIHLRLLAVGIAQGSLEGCGVEIVREGTMLLSPTGAFAIDIAEPCSGMRSLFAMMALTAGYSYFTQPTWFRRGLLLVLSIPIAVLGNVSRILSITAIAVTCSPDFATGFYHDYSGYVVFLVAVVLMVVVGGLITRGAERCARF